MGPAEESNFLLSFPHDESAVTEGRFCNGFFPERVPGHPMLAVRPFSQYFFAPEAKRGV